VLDLHSPRGPPPKGPRRPRPEDGGGNVGGGGGGGNGGGSTGGGGAVFDTFNDNARYRSAPAHVAQPTHWVSPQREPPPGPQQQPPPPPPPPAQPMPPPPPPNRVLTPIQVILRGSPPPVVNRPPPFGAIPIPPEGAPPYRPFDGSMYDSPVSPMYHPGAPMGEFAGERQFPRRNFDFRSEAESGGREAREAREA
jgi:hypothetical protein